jgi:hypothetical protein
MLVNGWRKPPDLGGEEVNDDDSQHPDDRSEQHSMDSLCPGERAPGFDDNSILVWKFASVCANGALSRGALPIQLFDYSALRIMRLRGRRRVWAKVCGIGKREGCVAHPAHCGGCCLFRSTSLPWKSSTWNAGLCGPVKVFRQDRQRNLCRRLRCFLNRLDVCHSSDRRFETPCVLSFPCFNKRASGCLLSGRDQKNKTATRTLSRVAVSGDACCP